METTENNKLIAEFMGGKEKKQSPLFGKSFIEIDTTNMDCYVSLPKYTNPKALKYNKSWDWLMPVVVKCFDEHEVYSDDLNFKLNDALLETNIESLYKAVVEFIKWYNENK